MDNASDQITAPDHGIAVGDLQQTLSTPAQAQNPMKSPETGVSPNERLTKGPEKRADQTPKGIPIAFNDSESRSPGKQSSTGEKQQFMVKLKYKTKIATPPPPQDHRSSSNVSSASPNLGATSAGTSDPSNETTFIKPEAEDHEDTALKDSDSNSTDPKIKTEKNGDDQDLALKPLSEPGEDLGQVNMVKEEPEHDAHQQVNDPSQNVVRDEMNVDAQLDNDATQVSSDHHVSDKLLEALGVQAAVSEPENMQEVPAAEVRRVDDVSGEYQQSANGSPTTRGENEAFDNGANISDPFGLDVEASDWNNLEANVASGSRQHQDHRAIPHQAMSHYLPIAGIDERQEERLDQESLDFLAGRTEAQEPWSQRHQVFADPVHFVNKSASPHYGSSRGLNSAGIMKNFSHYQTYSPRYVLQQPSGQYSGSNVNPGFDRQQQLQAQVEETRRQADQAKKMVEESHRQRRQSPYTFGHSQGQPGTLPSYLAGPMSYERAPQNDYPQMKYGQGSSGLPPSSMSSMHYVQEPLNGSNGFHPFTAKPTVPPKSNNWMPGPYDSQGIQNTPHQVPNEHDCGDEGDASDDDEPLRTRVERHPSLTSQGSVITGSSPVIKTKRVVRRPQQDNDSDVEFFTSNTKPKQADHRVVQAPVRIPPHQPGSSSPIPTSNAPPPSDNIEQIDWTLPQYEMQRQPLAKGEEIPSAKVSLPGMVREEVLLSPDHADEEARLLINLFIPGQQAMSSPDPEPAVALLNFHTIAVMVIEAYVQFEIGDEFGMGRGHFHQDHDRGEDEYERMRDAVDADTNEIFFAVVDRYRAGLESKKKPLQLIRGTQEFCDVALDVIYYIKQHGLLKPEPKAKKVRADKGVKRGPQAKNVAAGAVKGNGKGVKRGTEAAPNEVQPRKKTKTAPATEAKKRRSRAKEPGITVVKK